MWVEHFSTCISELCTILISFWFSGSLSLKMYCKEFSRPELICSPLLFFLWLLQPGTRESAATACWDVCLHFVIGRLEQRIFDLDRVNVTAWNPLGYNDWAGNCYAGSKFGLKYHTAIWWKWVKSLGHDVTLWHGVVMITGKGQAIMPLILQCLVYCHNIIRLSLDNQYFFYIKQ